MMNTPDKLNPEEITYHYLVALHLTSHLRASDHSSWTEENKKNWMKLLKIMKCGQCGQYYINNNIMKPFYCYTDHANTSFVRLDEFHAYAQACEEFRQGLHKISGINILTYAAAMKLYQQRLQHIGAK